MRSLLREARWNVAAWGRAVAGLVIASILSIILVGCGATSSKCLLPEERIGESYLYGMRYLGEKKSLLAAGAFKSILACNVKFAPAYSGLAIAYAQIAARGINPDGKTIVASLVALKMADKYSTGNEDDFRRHVAAVRAYTIYKSPAWFTLVENEYRLAMRARVDASKLPYYRSSDAAGYFMGNAYFDAGRIESAMAEYEALSQADSLDRWGRLSQGAFKRSGIILSHIERSVAEPEVVVLAFHRDITREDVAAILVGELKVDELLGVNEIQMGMRNKTSPVPVDIMKSPFKGKIQKVIRLDIKGLEPSYSSKSSSFLFSPRKVVSRKDFAVIIDDIFKRLSPRMPGFREKTHDDKSYSDVPPGEPWHNAVMDVTRFDLMKPASDKRFGPDESLDGPDAFSAVFTLKSMLNP